MASSPNANANATLFSILLSIPIVFSLVGPSISSPTTKIVITSDLLNLDEVGSLDEVGTMLADCIKNVTPELLRAICLKANDPALCFRTLRKDPRSSASNVLDLTTIYADLAYDKVSTIQKLYEVEAKKPDETFHLTPKYKACASDYSKNLVDLAVAKQRIRSGNNIAGVEELVKGTISRVEDCVKVLKFGGGEYFPKIYEFNHKYNPDALNLQSIVYALALELSIN